MSVRTEASLSNLSSIIANSRGRVAKPYMKKKGKSSKRHSLSSTSSLKSCFPVLNVSNLLSPLKPVEQSHSQMSSFKSLDSMSSFNNIKSLLYNPNEQEGSIYTITIKSNWGNPEKLSLSSINLLDHDRKIINIMSISSMPNILTDLEQIVSYNLVKTNNNDIWCIPWPQPNGNISIILKVSANDYPEYVRIWNPTTDTDCSVRDVHIYNGTEKVFSGEAPKGFGIDFAIASSQNEQSNFERCESKEVLQQLFPELIPERGVNDAYGKYPLNSINSVTLEITKTWSSEKNIGINGFDIYDIDHKKVLLSKISNIIIEGCSSFSDPDNLFKKSHETVDFTQMFMAETHWTETPKIIFHFEEPIKIVKIRIWNFNADNRNLKFGLRTFNIRFDDKIMYTGKMKMGTGKLASIGYNTSIFWFIDVPRIRNLERLEDEMLGQ
ncbi:hypothetical protein TRFO_12212 [Tritrichomonas foetus]|uniref:KATNIP domain-containing protein n=1 Tax=Tritrichomonas foetus TaxID=1144522 RepID=A0A1J4IZL7_9EUKA|nr:hypothetical protein TRFO_12212 [Tritrichomonas foetus]|eukprot:OHS92854.1 hypothetical protein TRFO_12212 [Tritrichomonas foetus]